MPSICYLCTGTQARPQGARQIDASQIFRTPVTILLVEDFAPYRAYVSSLLARHSQLNVVDEASQGLEAVEKARKWKPDLILMDIGLPLLNGIEAARRIREENSHSRIVFLSQDSSPEFVAEAIKLGACGYVSKSDAENDLLTAIETVLAGKQSFRQ